MVRVRFAAGLVACVSVLTACGSAGGNAVSSSTSDDSASASPTVVLTDPGNVAGSSPALGADSTACHQLFDPVSGGVIATAGVVDSLIVKAILSGGYISVVDVNSYTAALETASSNASVTLNAPIRQLIFDLQLAAISGRIDAAKVKADREPLALVCGQYPGVIQYTPPA